MKKIISLIIALSLAVVAAATLVACGNSATEKAEAPIVFNYTLLTETTEENGEETSVSYYTLKSVTISEAAQELVKNKNYAELARLFNTAVDGYTPAREYTADDVRTLVIPETYRNRAVKEISQDAVSGQTFVKKIVVGENIEKISEGAFSVLTELEEIELPFIGAKLNAVNEKKLFGYIFGTTSGDGLTACEQHFNVGTDSTKTYYLPSSLKTVTVSGGNEKKTSEVKYKIVKDDDGNDKYVFSADADYETYEEEELTATINDDEYAVSPYAFYNCSTLENVNVNGKYEKVEDYTFYGCTSLKELAFNDDTAEIGNHAFDGCTGVKKINFNKVTTIGEGAFNGCTNLGTAYADASNPLKVTANVIGESAFEGCTGLEKVEFTSGAVIGEKAFKGCAALKDLAFNANEVGYAAFYNCTALEKVDLSGVTELGEYAFYGCSALKEVAGYENFSEVAHAFDNTAM